MTAGSRIVVGPEAKPAPARIRQDPTAAWKLLRWVGILLLVAGTIDMALGFYPYNPESPQWRFLHGAALATSWPGLLLGLGIWAMASLGMGGRRGVLIAAGVNLFGVLVLLIGLLAMVGGYDTALSTVDLAVRPSLTKSYTRALLVGLIYLASMTVIVVTLIRSTVKSESNDR